MLVHANCHRDVKMTNRNEENKLPYHLGPQTFCIEGGCFTNELRSLCLLEGVTDC